MKKYWRHFVLAIQETIAYRAAYLINVLSGALAYVVIFFVWAAVFGANPRVGGLTWTSMKAYLLISLFTGALISGYSEFRISRQIRTGNIVVELLRPVGFLGANLAVTLGNSLTEGVLAGVLLIGFVLTLGLVPLPPDGEAWAGFLLAMPLSYLTKFLVLFIFSLFCFWTNSFMGLNWLRKAIADFFSGALIPLSFFPDGLRDLALALPFQGIVALPASLWLGQRHGADLWLGLGTQLAWVVVLVLIAKVVWHRALAKVTIQGG